MQFPKYCVPYHTGHRKSQHNASSVVRLTGCPIQRYKHCPITLGTGSPNTPQVPIHRHKYYVPCHTGHRRSQNSSPSITRLTSGTGSPNTAPQALCASQGAQYNAASIVCPTPCWAQEVPTQRLKCRVPHRVPNTTLQALCALHHARHKKSQHNASSVMCLTRCPIQRYKYCVPYTMLGTRSPNTTYTMLGTRSLNIGTTIYHLLSTTYHLPPTIYYLPSTIHHHQLQNTRTNTLITKYSRPNDLLPILATELPKMPGQ